MKSTFLSCPVQFNALYVRVKNSTVQWRAFQNNVPLCLVSITVHLELSYNTLPSTDSTNTKVSLCIIALYYSNRTGVLCICLFLHLSDLFHSSWSDVCRTSILDTIRLLLGGRGERSTDCLPYWRKQIICYVFYSHCERW